MAALKIVLTGVTDIENVCYAERLDHLRILCMLPLPQIGPPRKHFVAKLFGNGPVSESTLAVIFYKIFLRTVGASNANYHCQSRSACNCFRSDQMPPN